MIDKQKYLQYLDIDYYTLKLNKLLQHESENINITNYSLSVIIDYAEFNQYRDLFNNIFLSVGINIDSIRIVFPTSANIHEIINTNKVNLILDANFANKLLPNNINDFNSLRNKIHYINDSKIIVSFSLERLSTKPELKYKAWLDYILVKNLILNIDL